MNSRGIMYTDLGYVFSQIQDFCGSGLSIVKHTGEVLFSMMKISQ